MSLNITVMWIDSCLYLGKPLGYHNLHRTCQPVASWQTTELTKLKLKVTSLPKIFDKSKS